MFRVLLFNASISVMLASLGCASPIHATLNSSDVKTVKLTCIQLCLKMPDRPFLEKQFSDKDSVALLTTVINKAEPMPGILDYGVLFLMIVDLKDGEQKTFHLNISDTDQPQTRLLLKLPDSSHGFTIPEGLSRGLENLIYSS